VGAFVCFSAGLFGVLGAAVWASMRAVEEASHADAGWGEEVSSDEVLGDGAFRAARLVGHRPRGIPRLVTATGALGVALGILSSLLVAPASLVLAIFTSAAADSHVEVTLLTLAVAAASFLSGFFVYAASTGVLRCERGAGGRAVVVGRLALVLHALPIAWYCVSLGPGSGPTLAAFALYSVGAIHGALLIAAGARVAATQASMSEDELAALPPASSPSSSRARRRRAPSVPTR
jgi:hypothetical protein